MTSTRVASDSDLAHRRTMEPMASETRWIDVPGGRLHVVAEGSGPPIILVHAGIADLRSWDAVVPYLVDAGYRAIRYDTRAFGSSTTEDVEFSNRADLLAVLDELHVERAVLVGNSRGAVISLDTILESPERAVAFVSVGGGINGFDGGMTPEERDLEERAEAAAEAFDAETGSMIDVRLWVDGVGQSPERVPATVRDAVREMDRPLYRRDLVFGRPIPLAPPATERLSDVRLPVLAVVGELDTSGTRASAIRLEEEVAGARRVVLAGVAHMIGMEVPDRLAELIVEFVAPLQAWR